MSHFGFNIKKIRGIRGLTQQQLAEKLDVTRGSISSYEEGRAEPKIETILKSAEYFGLSVEALLREKLTVNQLIGFKHPVVSSGDEHNADDFSKMQSLPDFGGLEGDFTVLDTGKILFRSGMLTHGQVVFGKKSSKIVPDVWAILLDDVWHIDQVKVDIKKNVHKIGEKEFNPEEATASLLVFGIYTPVQHFSWLEDIKNRVTALEEMMKKSG
jgi:transcriptional regulator with XRE-family HTH domain